MPIAIKPIFISFLFLALATGANAQTLAGLTCFASTSTPFDMRAEGVTEQAGDVVVVCSGGTPTPFGAAVPQVNITIVANANITSRLINGSNTTTEALILIDDAAPAAQAYCTTPNTGCPMLGTGFGGGQNGTTGSPVSTSPTSTNPYSPSAAPGGQARVNVFSGVLAGGPPNIVTFFGVPVDPPGPTGGNLTFRITNVRMNVTSLGAPASGSFSTIGAFLTISSSAGFTMNNPVQTVGNIRRGLLSQMAGTPGTISQCVSTPAASFPIVQTVNFGEGFPTSTKLRLPAGGAAPLSIPGNFLNTESQYVPGGTLPSPNFGQADFATRVKITFAGLPQGAQLYVPTVISSAASGITTESLTLTASEKGPFAAVSTAALTGLPSGYSPLTISNTTATAIYEVTSQANNSSLIIENFSVPVAISYTAPSSNYTTNFGATTVTVDFAPSNNSIVVASGTDPISRFILTSPVLPGFTTTACTSPTGPPIVTIEQAASVNGTLTLTGYALDNTVSGTPIKTVAVTVDGVTVGNATYGASRPDICALYPARPGCPNVGFTYTGPISTGTHTVAVNATNSSVPPLTGTASVTVGPSSGPTVVSLSPLAGSGATQVFTAVYSDPAGSAFLNRVVLLINSSLAGAGSCFVQVDTSGIYLADDPYVYLIGPIASLGSASNSQCTVDSTLSGVVRSGNTWTVTLSITFKPAFTGPKNIYLDADDTLGNSTNYQLRGTFNVNSAPAPVSVAPASATATSQTFTATYTDTAGGSALNRRLFLINSTLNGAGACFVQADPTGIYLVTDSGLALLGPIAPGSTISNGQCTLNGTGASVFNFGSNSTVAIPLTFNASFAGVKTIFMYTDDAAANSGWRQMGTFTIPVTSLPTAVSVTPSAASGSAQTFSAVYSNSAGASYLKRRLFVINSALVGAGACFVQADATGIYLVNDAGSALLGPITGSTALTNNQCTLNGTGTSLVNSGTTSTVTVSLTFKASFAGPKNIYLYTEDSFGGNTGFQNLGTYSVAFPAPTADSVTLSSGTVSGQDFSAIYSDASGASTLKRRLFVINSSLSGAGACFVQSDPTGMYLVNDAGTGLIGPLAMAGGVSLSNSQCTLLTNSRTVDSGNTSTVNISVLFSSTFAGLKNIYMYADDNNGNNSGFQLRGTVVSVPARPTILGASPYAVGSSQIFTASYSDAYGAAAIKRRLFLVAASLNGAGACFVQADQTGIYLVDDTDSALLGPISPSGSLTNSQCTLNGKGSGITNSGTTSTVTIALVFKVAFAGAKNIYMYADDTTGANSGFQLGGSYIVNLAPSVPTVTSITPNSGSGASRTFTMVYSDAAGGAQLNRRLLLIASTLNGTGACLVQMDSINIYLANDADSALVGPLFTGLIGLQPVNTLTNSQCTLSSTGASISPSTPNSFTIILPVTFSPAFGGTHNIYMYADDIAGNNSGWQLMGAITTQ